VTSEYTLAPVTGAALGIAWLLTPMLRALARRLQLLDVPSHRSMHAVPTPRSGGNAILAGVMVGAVLSSAHRDRGVMVCLLGAAVIWVLAIADELREIPVVLRFLVQLGVATGVVVGAGLVLPGAMEEASSGLVPIMLSVLWIAWLLNAYNFMDGINGIASVEAIICGGTLALLLLSGGDPAGAALAAAIAGAAAGFLPWNLPGGSIFMGDTGSATLGLLLACLVLRASASVSVVAAALPLFPFVFDATMTLGRRILRGERFYAPHRTHVYQRLVSQGWSHARVTLLYGTLAVGCGLLALRYERLSVVSRAASLLVVLAVHAALAVIVYARVPQGANEGPA
jgi:UDP-GlcNAc:undecaprenyl-phosphate/decaprenyl-phosphate GlcNAc-1-phosphate transferase